MKKFTIIYTECRALYDVMAETAEDAREMFVEGLVDYSKSECYDSEICEVYESENEEVV